MKNKGFTKKKLQIKSNWDKNLTLSADDQQSLKGGLDFNYTGKDDCYVRTWTDIRNC